MNYSETETVAWILIAWFSRQYLSLTWWVVILVVMCVSMWSPQMNILSTTPSLAGHRTHLRAGRHERTRTMTAMVTCLHHLSCRQCNSSLSCRHTSLLSRAVVTWRSSSVWTALRRELTASCTGRLTAKLVCALCHLKNRLSRLFSIFHCNCV